MREEMGDDESLKGHAMVKVGPAMKSEEFVLSICVYPIFSFFFFKSLKICNSKKNRET
jgi:hypothetical protein